MQPLKISISGIRGIVGQTFTPELATQFAQSFGTYINAGSVLVGRDTRPSGEMVRAAVIAGLLSTGCEVIDLGICPTPSLQLAVQHLKAKGGIAITAGHNPERWNALKFVRPDGIYLNARQGEELLDIYHQGEFRKARWNALRRVQPHLKALSCHIDKIVGNLDVACIRRKKFVVAVDCCNGACALLTPELLHHLGCKVVAVNDEIGARFPHEPDPNPSNMAQLRALVKASGADIGFCHDADGERLGIVTETGEALSEERTLVLLTAAVLSRKPGLVVTNLSTTEAVEAVAGIYGCRVIRTGIGQAYVSETVKEQRAVIGGEGSGGVIFPEVHYSHDSAAAIGHLLQHLARTDTTISHFSGSLPQLHMLKRNLALSPRQIYQILQHVRAVAESKIRGAQVNFADGIRIRWRDGWLHLRDSNTESMIRIIAEGGEGSRAESLMDWAIQRIREVQLL